ncbi:elongator complex protein 3 [Clostridium tyrobutyricum]|uniref:elongator complex protein 3 n=1 Tax=Clostridium tyrobutyricum TaxID=1519 RepID=UPI001C3915F6|nr:radical SAM protein [Clostridium tyrobutyricum]MBV4440735.1 radical SAM protein [Clostridium tyrobutyricum]
MSNKHYIIPIFVPNEGCPHNCVFCDQTTITGSQKKVDADFTRNTIDKYLNTINSHKAKVEVSFFGGTFTAIDIKKQTELLKVAKKYKDAGLIDLIHLSTRPDYIDNTILDNLKSYGVDVIELGVQSLDEEVLFKSGRGHSKEDVLKASALIKKYGFTLGHQIMLGLPGDNFQKDISSVKQSIDMKPDIYRIYPSLIIKNTPMEDMYKKGIYSPYSLEEAIYITKILYCMLISNKINIIRVGLQPTEEINVGAEIVSGPFHPAFRELVIGSIYSEFLRKNIPYNYSGKVKIQINGKDISKLYANGKRFFNDVKLQLNVSKIQVVQDNSLKRDTFILNLEEDERKLYFDIYLASKDFKY